MRIIPVIDLKDGIAVHAVKGERDAYQPLKSALVDNADPLTLANAFREKLGLSEAYIADLDAILYQRAQENTLDGLVRHSQMKLMVDAGIHNAHDVRKLLSSGVDKVIIGAETVTSWDELQEIRANIPGERLVFSLDMRAGEIISRCPEISELSPIEAIQLLYQRGWQEMILLDLARVGTQTGIDNSLVAAVRQKYPQLKLLVGGGIRNYGELLNLKNSGVSGVLVGTILHHGLLDREQISALA